METKLSPHLTIMTFACQKIANFMLRDFGEVEQLQSSINGSDKFANFSKIKVEKTLIETLLEARPKYGILTPNQEVKGADISHRFIINIIDGFENFSHGLPSFCVSIVLQEQKGLQACVIYNPVLDKMFYAERGMGAFIYETRMTRRLRISGKRDYTKSMVNYSGPNITELKLKSPLNLTIIGSDGLALCYVAGGMIDGYIGFGKNVFELAAGALLVKEAGGIVQAYDSDGKITDKLFEANMVICGNNYLQSELKSIIIKKN